VNSLSTRILCIEDNAMNWRLVQRLLSQAGYEMHWAEDGLKGCEMALELKPALILLDINLPGLSGFEVATKLRQSSSMEETIIVALTAKTMRIDRETALVTGCDGFISKPIDPFQFVEQVEGYLGGRKDHLEQGREGAALRQFTQQVVGHLESQLREAQDSNRRLVEVQSELEARSQHLSRLLSLSKDIIPIRDTGEVSARVLGQLRTELRLDHLRSYRLHSSGTYFLGLEATPEGFQDIPVLPATHPIALWSEAIPAGVVLAGPELRQASIWQQGVQAGLWPPKAQGLMLPLRSRSEEDRLRGFLVAGRDGDPFQPFEIELAALHAGILQVSLENAGLIAHLDETSRALGTSYEGLESAYEALKEAQRALGAQNRKTALGGLFLGMAQRLQGPVLKIKEESVHLAGFLNAAGNPTPEDRAACQRSMDQVLLSIDQVEGMVRALMRRAGQGEAGSPEWVHLHELLMEEMDLMKAEGLLPEYLPVELNFMAPRDLLLGVHSDFSEVFAHLFRHALEGDPGQLILRSWGGVSHFRLELEDDGNPIDPVLLATAFEPFPDLRPAVTGLGRRPGAGLPACAQLMNAYGGTVEILPTERGSLLRISLPMD